MEQSGTRTPKGRPATRRPTPIAIRMQHDPRFVAKRSGQMHHHGVDADDNIQLPHAVTQFDDVWRADVSGSNLVGLA